MEGNSDTSFYYKKGQLLIVFIKIKDMLYNIDNDFEHNIIKTQ